MHPKVKRIYMPRAKLFLSIVLAATLIVGSVKIVRWGMTLSEVSGLTPGTIIGLLFNAGAQLKQLEGRTNIALLGTAGGTNAGADLTDTILIVSFHHDRKTLSLISLPRDIWSDTLKDKINSAYHYGEEKKKGGGLIISKVIIEDIVGLPIHYAVLVDFFGFQEVIDLVGGVTITVPQAFDDPEFPVPGREEDLCGGDPKLTCRFEPLHFDAGTQTMDGARALKYVRSRQALGDEGSDFARARRQQEVLLALKQKLTSPAVWVPGRAGKLLRAFEKATESDMKVGELATVGKLLAGVKEDHIVRISLEDHLYPPRSLWYGRYVLLPTESFGAIHNYVKEQLQ